MNFAMKLALKYALKQLTTSNTSEFWLLLVNGLVQVLTHFLPPELHQHVQPLVTAAQPLMYYGIGRVLSKIVKGEEPKP